MNMFYDSWQSPGRPSQSGEGVFTLSALRMEQRVLTEVFHILLRKCVSVGDSQSLLSQDN